MSDYIAPSADRGQRGQLPPEVFCAELEEIDRRRDIVGAPSRSEPERDEPSASQGLVGLALSGGGIRSATFSLGVIQALAARGVFDRVDYLSTVSGGGFTGSMLSSVLNVPRADQPEFPLARRVGHPEPPALRHLRDNSEYLSSGSLADSFRLPMVIVRGLIFSLLFVLPFVILAVFLTELAYEAGLWPNYYGLTESRGPAVVWGGILVFVGGVCLALPIRRLLRRRLNWGLRNRGERLLALGLFAVVVAVGLEIAVFLTSIAIETDPTSDELIESIFSRLGLDPAFAVPVLLGLTVVLVIAFIVTLALARDLAINVALTSVGVLGPVLVFGLYLSLCVVQIDSPFVRADLSESLDKLAGARASAPADELDKVSNALADKDPRAKLAPGEKLEVVYGSTTGSCDESTREWVVLGPDLLASAPPGVLDELDDCVHLSSLGGEYWGSPETCVWPGVDDEGVLGLTSELLDSCRASFRLHPANTDVFAARRWLVPPLVIRGGSFEMGGSASASSALSDRDFLLLALIALFYVLAFYSANNTSLHSFYRDRLTGLYLFRVAGQQVSHEDKLLLSELGGQGSAAPYHLVNVVLNVSDGDADRRNRHGEFLVLSKRYCGGSATGYIETKTLESIDSRMNLGTAMAISGAAASPNMGSNTSGPLVFVMTLLNLRMNYWMPNPCAIHRYGAGWWRYRAGPRYLWREATSSLSAETPLINVSDGGHLENLGLYELLRRRCRTIIVVDGEHDPEMRFGALMTVARYAKIDLGIEIDVQGMKLERFRPNEQGLCGTQWASATIDYGDGEHGRVVYIKSCLSSCAASSHLQYRDRNEEFPHESTADQFFSEEQFEAYRSLGEHIGEVVLAGPESPLADLVWSDDNQASRSHAKG